MIIQQVHRHPCWCGDGGLNLGGLEAQKVLCVPFAPCR